MIECPLCNGQDPECEGCKGTGETTKKNDQLVAERPCTFCYGNKVIAAGAWTTMSEAHDCERCKGTGIEPKVAKPTRSSPFEEDALGATLFDPEFGGMPFTPDEDEWPDDGISGGEW